MLSYWQLTFHSNLKTLVCTKICVDKIMFCHLIVTVVVSDMANKNPSRVNYFTFQLQYINAIFWQLLLYFCCKCLKIYNIHVTMRLKGQTSWLRQDKPGEEIVWETYPTPLSKFSCLHLYEAYLNILICHCQTVMLLYTYWKQIWP